MNYKDKFLQFSEMANEYISTSVPKENSLQKTIFEAMNYSLCAGGKRLRPVLVLSFCEACGQDAVKALPFAAAIEMIHTYSLIHDDLPCMDNDDLRRGRPTSHKVFGEGIAVLAGDALLNFAAETIINKGKEAGFSDTCLLKALNELYTASGAYGMIGGQVIDLEHENKEISFDNLRKLHSLKTGALIKAACALGCIAAERYDMLEKAYAYGDALGRAFQVTDDILDVISTNEDMGKTVGKDANEGKATYVTLCSLEKAKEYALQYTKEGIEAAQHFENSEYLEWICNYVLSRKS
ncbi:MAG: polyprenyl synthetase family protein [Ruminococcaceae bacterium]|nr:polyprenyl synthetase family protein [Oscillospiraceae bacterium]